MTEKVYYRGATEELNNFIRNGCGNADSDIIISLAITIIASPFKKHGFNRYDGYDNEHQIRLIESAVSCHLPGTGLSCELFYEKTQDGNMHAHGTLSGRINKIDKFSNEVGKALGYPVSKNGSCCILLAKIKNDDWINYCKKDQKIEYTKYDFIDLPLNFNPWKKGK